MGPGRTGHSVRLSALGSYREPTKHAALYIQSHVRRRQVQLLMTARQLAACVCQRYFRGHMVQKRTQRELRALKRARLARARKKVAAASYAAVIGANKTAEVVKVMAQEIRRRAQDNMSVDDLRQQEAVSDTWRDKLSALEGQPMTEPKRVAAWKRKQEETKYEQLVFAGDPQLVFATTKQAQADFEQKCEAGIVVRCDDGNFRAVFDPLRVRELMWQPLARSATRAKFLTEEEEREQKEEEVREARTEEMFSQTGELTTVKDYDPNTQTLKRPKVAVADLTSPAIASLCLY